MSGCVYKLKNLDDGKSYIGQTTMKLNKRLACHKCSSKSGKNRCYSKTFNYDNVTIEELPPPPPPVLNNLDAQERWYITNTPNCVNKNVPYRTYDEKLAYKRLYYSDVASYDMLRKVTCECGTEVCRQKLNRHRRSLNHKNLMEIILSNI